MIREKGGKIFPETLQARDVIEYSNRKNARIRKLASTAAKEVRSIAKTRPDSR